MIACPLDKKAIEVENIKYLLDNETIEKYYKFMVEQTLFDIAEQYNEA